MTYRADQDYFVARANEETKLAYAAATPRSAAIHFELAYRYAIVAYRRPLRAVRGEWGVPHATDAHVDLAKQVRPRLAAVATHA